MRIVAGQWGGRRLSAPRGRDTRPTTDRVREAWMSIVAPALEDANVLDLFAGSGALGLEALSRGAKHATFVESAASALRALQSNVRALGADSGVTVVRSDAIRYAEGLEPLAFDVAFADPPYERGLGGALLEIFERQPFARWLSVEHARGEAVPRLPGAIERRYGDTLITIVPAPE